MDPQAHGTVADHPTDCDPLITASLFWLLLTSLAALCAVVLVVAGT
jgi:hypothetical protein